MGIINFLVYKVKTEETFDMKNSPLKRDADSKEFYRIVTAGLMLFAMLLLAVCTFLIEFKRVVPQSTTTGDVEVFTINAFSFFSQYLPELTSYFPVYAKVLIAIAVVALSVNVTAVAMYVLGLVRFIKGLFKKEEVSLTVPFITSVCHYVFAVCFVLANFYQNTTLYGSGVKLYTTNSLSAYTYVGGIAAFALALAVYLIKANYNKKPAENGFIVVSIASAVGCAIAASIVGICHNLSNGAFADVSMLPFMQSLYHYSPSPLVTVFYWFLAALLVALVVLLILHVAFSIKYLNDGKKQKRLFYISAVVLGLAVVWIILLALYLKAYTIEYYQSEYAMDGTTYRLSNIVGFLMFAVIFFGCNLAKYLIDEKEKKSANAQKA